MKLQVTVEGKRYEVEVEIMEREGPGPIGGGTYSPRPAAGAPPAPSASTGSAPTIDVADDKAIKSPLAGNVVRVNVEAGQKVSVDETVIVLEAMKMETAVTCPVEATVKTVHVAVGEAVKQGQVLIEFE